jgi:hypothetical protein
MGSVEDHTCFLLGMKSAAYNIVYLSYVTGLGIL